MVHRPLLTLAAACLLVGPARAAGPAQGQGEPDARAHLAELEQRDQRLSFTADSQSRARAVLEGASAAAGPRSLAVLVLGEGRKRSDLARLETLAQDGEPEVRSAALFALGRMGSDGAAALERAGEHVADGTAPTLAVAWLLAEARGAPARARLAALAQGDSELARSARQALDHLGGAPPGSLAPALELYYDLRWRAAQAHGLVDGQRWQRIVLAGLLTNDAFLDGVILGSLGALPAGAVRAHLLELLREEGLAALRALVVVLPEDVARAVESGAWSPTPESWRAMLEEIDRERVERRALPLLERAREAAPELAFQADLLRFRGGGAVPWSWVSERLTQGTSEERAALVAACGDRGEKQLLAALSELLDKQSDPGLAALGLIARARLAQASAQGALETLVAAPASEPRDGALHALAAALHDKRLWHYGKEALRREDLAPGLRRELVLALAAAGEEEARDELRTALPSETDPSACLLAVRALCRKGALVDLPVLRELFPADHGLELHIEIGRALVLGRDLVSEPVLLAALWRERWSQSVLTGGLIVRNFGLRALMDQLGEPPRAAREVDLRRVGFTVGEWGGLEAVEELARTRQEGDAGLQGALLGALSARAAEASAPEEPKPAVLDVPPR